MTRAKGQLYFLVPIIYFLIFFLPIDIKKELVEYIVALIGATRGHPLILRGASPRATLSLTAMAKAVAYVQRRDYVVPKDIQVTFPQVIAHRLLLAPEADARQIGPEQILAEILRQVPAPRL